MTEFASHLTGRENLTLELVPLSDGRFKPLLRGVGDLHFLKSLKQTRDQLSALRSAIELSNFLKTLEGKDDTFSVMLREVLLKATGQWSFPFPEAELCHCRMVATALVDDSVVAGAHKPARVSRETNASTQCGTCRPDVEKIIAYRLGLSS